MKPMHTYQLQILQKLLFSQGLRFSDLRPFDDMENNQLTFHIDQLIEQNLVKKEKNIYILTPKGKEYACRIDTDKTEVTKQAKVSIFTCPIKKVNGKTYYMIYTRIKQPFYGCQGFISGKVRYGEKIIDAAKRELLEETGLIGIPELVSVKHYHVLNSKTREVLEDKIMFMFRVLNPEGELAENSEGKNEWIEEKDLFIKVTNPFESMADFKSNINDVQNFNGQITLEEIDHFSSKF